jgi:hypothetical protein
LRFKNSGYKINSIKIIGNNNLIVLGFENKNQIAMIIYDPKNMVKSILS